ncbi:hypothetical protein F4776DRAFT_481531 [Hypoxylon sp. NC0597]|nr:hypothetical protein F4776DRAFT_481531 [Hypoxylon sp. NC0597]
MVQIKTPTYPTPAVQATLGQTSDELAAHVDGKLSKLYDKVEGVDAKMDAKCAEIYARCDDISARFTEVRNAARQSYDKVGFIDTDAEKQLQGEFARVDTELNLQHYDITDARQKAVETSRELKELRDQVRGMGKAMRSQFRELHDIIQKLQTAVDTHAKVAAASQSKVQDVHVDVSCTHESRPQPRLPNPPMLTDPANLRVWIVQMRSKLAVDGETIGSPEVQCHYVFALLNPEAQKIAVSAIRLCHEENYWDYEAIFTLLNAFYP